MALITFGGFVFWSIDHLDAKTLDPDMERLEIARLGAHALISVAGIFGLYQVLRSAERLALPHWLATRNIELAKVLLGISDPAGASLKLAEKVADAVRK